MIEEILGISSDYIILGLAVLVLIIIILLIANMVQLSKLKKKYTFFMKGSNGKSLEDTLIYRLEQVDELIETNASNERNIDLLFKKLNPCVQKYGIVKYDAFNEMGGKLSFSLCMLDEKDNGYVLNAVHSREGCYTYIKEIIDGNSIINLSEEEAKALDKALEG